MAITRKQIDSYFIDVKGYSNEELKEYSKSTILSFLQRSGEVEQLNLYIN